MIIYEDWYDWAQDEVSSIFIFIFIFQNLLSVIQVDQFWF